MVNLSGEWISSFIQNNKIYNEKVVMKQSKSKLTAYITLNFDGDLYKYKFVGSIHKNVINGTYEYLDNCEIESGTISLKIINDNFLYGVTTYISMDELNDDVIQSPYALFRNTDNNLGTFDICHNCVNTKANCCSNPAIDSPMLLPNEALEISKLTNKKIEDFAKLINFSSMYNDNALKNLYQMKRQDNSNSCYFYKNSKCTIYDIRPIDCRIFPYDIKLEKDGNYYLVYYLTNNCEIKNIDFNNLKAISYNTRLFFRLLLPYLREWSDPYCSYKLTENEDYKIICKIEDLF